LFPKGLNLVILELVNNDITNNVEIICPTTLYSREIYRLDRPTAIIVHEKTGGGSYFEPIYLYKTDETKIQITKTFLEKDAMVPETLRLAMRHVFLPTLNTRCLPQSSKPALYKFRAPIPLEELFGMAKPMGYIAAKQIVNYQGKVGYLVLKRDNQELPVPCAPSAILSDPSSLQLQFMEDESYFSNERISIPLDQFKFHFLFSFQNILPILI
jgi:hypothetical protein